MESNLLMRISLKGKEGKDFSVFYGLNKWAAIEIWISFFYAPL